jgi:MutS domain V
MRSLLMHAKRDFNAHGVFTDLMYQYRKADEQRKLPPHQQALVQDLELNTLMRAMARDDDFLLEVVREALLSGVANDVKTIQYRQDVLKDCINEETVIRQLYDLTVEAIEQTRRRWWSLSSTYPSSLLHDAIEMLEVLARMLRKLRSIAGEHAGRFRSKGFTALFMSVTSQLGESYLASIADYLTELRFCNGVLMSAELGEWNESTNLVLRKLHDKKQNWLQRIIGKGPPGYTFHLHERDIAGARILADLRQRGINRVVIALAQSADHVLSFFRMLRTELAFYVGCLNLHARLAAKGDPVCMPNPALPGVRQHGFRGLYDVSLSLHLDGKVVANSADAGGKNLVIITGANQGGKSSFLRSIGLAQLMMQSGMFVGAESFTAEVCPGLFTHYKREEDATMKSGKFDEELARLSGIVDRIRPNSLLMFNESFAATNEREGSEIAKQIVGALLERRVKVFFVTHLYEFARAFFVREPENALFLRAERRPDGTRTFKILEGEPFETSYGADLYRQVFSSNAKSEAAVNQPRSL